MARFGSLQAARLILVLMLVVGAALYAGGSRLPPYTDPAAAERLKLKPSMDDPECAGEQWYRDMDNLRTRRHTLMDGGGGLMLFAATGLVILAAAGRRRALSLADLRTPRHVGTFFALGVSAMIMFVAAVSHSFVIELRRDYLPWCADSIAIGMFSAWAGGIVLLTILLAAGTAICLFFGPLPARLWLWDHSRPVRSWLWTVLTGLFVAALLLALVDVASTSMFLGIPSCVIGTYLALSARAAALSREPAAEPNPLSR
ncbi:MAG: hypothetical protein M3177_01765 [Pseudomonadota bacterium]|nr:hypothetical protein [Pseudomonadota bacterium]